MSTQKARSITRWTAVAVMAAAVVTATADGFAQSYAGLYAWALEHGLHGWKAASFPLMVDLLIAVGELGLFLMAIDAYTLQRRQFLSWFDFLLPLMIAIAGWTASLIFNVGHVKEESFSYRATAAVPPIVSMLGLLVLLRTLHRYVSDRSPNQPDDMRPSPYAAVAAGDGLTADAPAAASAPEPGRRGAEPAGGVRLVPLTAWTLPAGEGAARRSSHPEATGAAAQAAARAAAEAPDAPAVPVAGDPPVAATVPVGNGSQRPAAEAGEPVMVSQHGPARGGNGGSNGGSNGRANGDANESANGSAGVGGTSRAGGRSQAPEAAPVGAEPSALSVSTMDRPYASKDMLLEKLHRHHGDVASAVQALHREGYDYDEDEARRIRRNLWLPYVVYRLLAQHGGDVNQVSQALVDRGIDCESAVLDELARSWQ